MKVQRQYAIHGMSRTFEYSAWLNMKGRCYTLTNTSYKYYGQRGIKVCDKWLYSFAAFFKDMGKRPGLEYTLERINNDSDYEPGNCKWATWEEQNNNRRLSSLCKEFKAISPIGRVYVSRNQREFARQFNLYGSHLNGCLNNKRQTHRSWRFEYI